MRRPILTLGVISTILCGCAGARVTGVSAQDPDGPNLVVTSQVWGLNHVVEVCAIEAEYGEWKAEAPVPIDPAGPGEQIVDSTITRWVQNFSGRVPPNGMVRVRFLYRRQPLHEVMFPAPQFNPMADMVASNRTSQPPVTVDSTTGPNTTQSVLTEPDPPRRTLPRAISNMLDSPTEIQFPSDLRCGIRSNTSPQYALVYLPPGRVKLVIDVDSYGDASAADEAPTWWRIELLDEDGISKGADYEIFGYIESGDEIRTFEVWSFDGQPYVIKLMSGSNDGDAIRVQFQPEEDSHIPR
jgi:hypothetical protein